MALCEQHTKLKRVEQIIHYL